MAVDICSELPSLVVSPRISFSHDLREVDIVPVEYRSDALLLNSTIDFNFCIGQTFTDLSPADELFANGKILPNEFEKGNVFPQPLDLMNSLDIDEDFISFEKSSLIQRSKSSCAHANKFSESLPVSKVVPEEEIHQPEPILGLQTSKTPSITKTENSNEDTKKKRLKEFLSTSFDADEEKPSSKNSKPFWQFRRSSSMTYDNNHSKGLFPSLQILLRSNSTGSTPNQRPPLVPKIIQKQHSQKQQSATRAKSDLSSSNLQHSYSSSKRTSLHKNCRSHGNGVRISPVLNIPPTYISVNLFGLGSFFCNGKSKKKKK